MSQDGEFDNVTGATAASDVAAYETGLGHDEANTAAWTDFDVPVRGLRRDKQVNLRWILTYFVEETYVASATWTFFARRSPAALATDQASRLRVVDRSFCVLHSTVIQGR